MDTTKQHANLISGNPLLNTQVLILILALGTAVTTRAQSADEAPVAMYHLLYSFHGNPDGCLPLAGPLVQDALGNLYGTTDNGGQFSKGTVFKVTPGGTETVLHSFAGPPSDGEYPQYASLTLDSAGNVYGTMPSGGSFSYGVVFKVTATGTESILHNFTGGTDGGYPYGGLVRDSAGNLYGTTELGGTFGAGVVFKLTASDTESVLHNFKFSSTDGYYPGSNLVRDSSGNLYGTTAEGGAFSGGTAFKVSPSGGETLLHSFKGYPVDGALGAVGGGLLRDTLGNLYGVTAYGGRTGDGVVFKLTTTLTESVLFNFNGSNSGGNPYTVELAEDAAGNLYGTTVAGGSGVGCPFDGCGLLFELSAGKEIVLHNFTISSTDGAYPYGGVRRDSSGNLYGVLEVGGASGCGAVFKYTP